MDLGLLLASARVSILSRLRFEKGVLQIARYLGHLARMLSVPLFSFYLCTISM